MSSSYVKVANDNVGKEILLLPHGNRWCQVVVGIDFPHHEIHEGDAFAYHDVITLGNGATQNYVIVVPNSASWPHFSYSIEGLYGITVELFEGSDRSPTTLQSAYNRNRNSINTAALSLYKGYTGGTTDGTRILWRKSGSGEAGGKLSGSSNENTERILKQNTQYTLRITSAAASNDIAVEFDWYEHEFE